MSILAHNNYGWFICSKTYFNELYKNCKDSSCTTFKLRIKDAFFTVKTPFLMNSTANKIGKNANTENIFKAQNSTKKKKKKPQTNDSGELDDFVVRGTKSLLDILKKDVLQPDATGKDFFENNLEAKLAAKTVCDFKLATELHFANSSLSSLVKSFEKKVFLMPPQSVAHQINVSQFFSVSEKKYDLILLDPPWPNRCVKRKHSYSVMKYEVLENLPIPSLTKPGCLLVVWTTNSPSAVSFVLDDLFPKCNVVASAIWKWCKVTTAGRFVCDVHSQHKKPYESIVLGRVGYGDAFGDRRHREPEPNKLVVSVPSSIHSHKPPLVEILQQYVGPDPDCLELFARYLLPGWESVGDEVLKLQNIELFESSC